MADPPTRPSFRLRANEHRLVLLLSDLAASTLAAFLAAYFWKQYVIQGFVDKGIEYDRAVRILRIQGFQVPFWFYVLPLVWLLLMVELYDAHAAVDWRRTVRGIVLSSLLGLVVYALIFIFNQDPTASLPRLGVGAFIVLAAVFTLILRLSYIRLYTASGMQRRVLIVGAGKAGMTLAKVYCEANPPPFSLIGFIDDDYQKIDQMYAGYPVIGASKDLLAIVDQYRVSDVVMAITGDVQGSTFQTVLDAQERGVEVSRMPTIYEEITQRVPVHHLESDWLIRSFVDQLKVSMFYEFIKRVLDLIGGLLGLAVFAISFPFIALAVVIDSGLPILYSQDRLGKGGQPFKIYKYRTMVKDAEPDGLAQQATVNDDRVTRVGSFLRITHLDELPQFWNVLDGDMSLVGPRAERAQLIAEYQKQIPFYRARLLVKPGLTGWAQINYGYVASVTETAIKLEYDLYYIKHRSLVLDVAIILRTIGTVLSRKGR